MRRSEIVVGSCYSNGKGRVRKVLAVGPQFKYYRSAVCSENLRYEVIQDGSKGNSTFGTMANCSLASFASWAKERVDDMLSCEFNPTIAYNNPDGSGFENGITRAYYPGFRIPYLEEGFNTVADAWKRVQQMREDGYKNVTLFAMPEDHALVPPELISWDYVFSRRIWLDEDAEHWNMRV